MVFRRRCFFMIRFFGMNSQNWYFTISGLINAIASTLLAIYIFFSNRHEKLGKYMIFLCLMFAAWAYPYVLWLISDTYITALFWAKVLMYGAIMVPTAYFHLVVIFLKLDSSPFHRRFLIFFYSLSLLWISLVFSPYFVATVQPQLYFKFWPMAGPLYAPFLLNFFVEIAYASILLFKKFRSSTGIIRVQSGLLLIGIFIAVVGGSTNYFLWYGIQVAPWGNGLVILYVFLTVYAMIKYRFMDIKVIFAELFTGLLILLLLVDSILSKNVTEFLFRIFALIVLVIFGVLFIKSTRKEIQQREEALILAQDLQDANTRLQELDRQKTEFLSIASHQLRTPLSVINGYIGLLQDGAYGKPPAEMKEIFQNMDESNTRLTKLVDEFLDITRIEQGRTKFYYAPHDVNEIVESAVKELRERAAQKGLQLVWEHTIPHMASVDDEKIRHGIYNFIDNAIKYSEKGTITVKLENQGGGLAYTVTDEGLGFDETDRLNFFQKFYRGENVQHTNVNGTGLGLYVVSKFIEAHGGKVWAKSPGLGKGSEFGFWIPLDREKRKNEA